MMKSTLFCLSLGVGIMLNSPVKARGETRPLPSDTAATWSLEVEYPHVAAGGIADEAHQTPFTIRAINSTGKPVSGLSVSLPHIWNELGDLSEQEPDYPFNPKPKVEWGIPSEFALTDNRGEVHGVFTSGGTMGEVTLRGPSTTQAIIDQVWHDNPNPLTDYREDVLVGDKVSFTYTLSLQRGKRTLPITGHHFVLLFTKVKFKGARLGRERDKNGNLLPEGSYLSWALSSPPEDGTATAEEKARWQTIESWMNIDDFKETSPGVYKASSNPELPGEKDDSKPLPVLDGLQIMSIEGASPYIRDKDVFRSWSGWRKVPKAN